MLNRPFRRHRWISSFCDHITAFQIPAHTEVVRSRLSNVMRRASKPFERINWRSPLLLGFALSLVYWIGLFGWMVADVNFKAFRYAGF